MVRSILHSQRGTLWNIAPGSIKSRSEITRSLWAVHLPVLLILALGTSLMLLAGLVHAWKTDALLRLTSGHLGLAEMLTLLFLGVAGLSLPVLLWLILKTVSTESRIAMDREAVSFRSICQGEEMNRWSEPLSNYRGVLAEKILRLSTRPTSPRSFVAFKLLHEDPEKTLLLAREDNCAESLANALIGESRSRLESYARALNVPAIERDPQGHLVARNVKSLEKPLGTAADAHERPPAPPRELLVEETGEGLKVTAKFRRAGLRDHLVAAAVGLALGPVAVAIILSPMLIVVLIRNLAPSFSPFVAWNLATLAVMVLLGWAIVAWQRATISLACFHRLGNLGSNFVFALNRNMEDEGDEKGVFRAICLNISRDSIQVEMKMSKGAIRTKQASHASFEEVFIIPGPFIHGLLLAGDEDTFWIKTPSEAAAIWLRKAILFQASRAYSMKKKPRRIKRKP